MSLGKLAAFDLESGDLIPDDDPLGLSRTPIGITCAGVHLTDGDGDDGTILMYHGEPPHIMTPDRLVEFVRCLEMLREAGYLIASWNGVSFDLALLAVEIRQASADNEFKEEWTRRVALLAAKHWDLMFQLWCLKGHWLGLDKAARGLGVPGKSAKGTDAVTWWLSGQWWKTLEYQRGDVQALTRVARAVVNRDPPGIPWLSGSGWPQWAPMPRPLLANVAVETPLPARYLVDPKPAYQWVADTLQKGQATETVSA